MLEGCKIYVHDVAAATGMRLHARYTPCGWPHVQHADEAWISLALRTSPWRVADPEQADIIYLDGGEFARWCTATRILAMRNTQQRRAHADQQGELACDDPLAAKELPSSSAKAYLSKELLKMRRKKHPTLRAEQPAEVFRDEVTKRTLWQLMLNSSAALLSDAGRGAAAAAPRRRGRRRRMVPRVVALTSNECPAPYRPRSSPLEDDLLLLVDQRPRGYDVVTPYVVSAPPWLAAVKGAAPPPDAPAWSARKLLFFAGHTPKLTQSPTRYLLWKQLRRSPHVTALSSTIGCNVASYEVCESASRVATESGDFCQAWCGSRILCTGDARMLKQHCKVVLKHVNFTDERDDLRAAARGGRLSHPEYLRLARAHRFCLVAPGDFVSTHKITEAMAVGGSGGCVPVFVMPADGPAAGRRGLRLFSGGARGMLPYTSWLDWCSVAYVVDEEYARTDAAAMLRALLAVTAEEHAQKLRALAAVRGAFVFRRGSSPSEPTAAEHILDEACRSAKRLAASSGGSATVRAPPGGAGSIDLSRCTLGRRSLGRPPTAAAPWARPRARAPRRRMRRSA